MKGGGGGWRKFGGFGGWVVGGIVLLRCKVSFFSQFVQYSPGPGLRANSLAQFNMVKIQRDILKNAMGRSQSNCYSENQPLTPRDRSHALGPSPWDTAHLWFRYLIHTAGSVWTGSEYYCTIEIYLCSHKFNGFWWFSSRFFKLPHLHRVLGHFPPNSNRSWEGINPPVKVQMAPISGTLCLAW